MTKKYYDKEKEYHQANFCHDLIKNKTKILKKFKNEIKKEYPKFDIDSLNQKQLECLHLAITLDCLEEADKPINIFADFIKRDFKIVDTDSLINFNPDLAAKVDSSYAKEYDNYISIKRAEFADDMIHELIIIDNNPKSDKFYVAHYNEDYRYDYYYNLDDDDAKYCIVFPEKIRILMQEISELKADLNSAKLEIKELESKLEPC